MGQRSCQVTIPFWVISYLNLCTLVADQKLFRGGVIFRHLHHHQCSLSTPKIMTSLQSDAPPEKRRSYLIRGPCRYAFGRLECPCTEGARALDIDSLSGLSDAICEICEHSLDVHNDYRGYVPISDLHH